MINFLNSFQYDPIYNSSMIEASGIAQSILYELLYEKVNIFQELSNVILFWSKKSKLEVKNIALINRADCFTFIGLLAYFLILFLYCVVDLFDKIIN